MPNVRELSLNPLNPPHLRSLKPLFNPPNYKTLVYMHIMLFCKPPRCRLNISRSTA